MSRQAERGRSAGEEARLLMLQAAHTMLMGRHKRQQHAHFWFIFSIAFIIFYLFLFRH